MPEVTVDDRPKGLPTAMTKSPTFASPARANCNSRKLVASTFKSAISVSGSVPTSSASTLRRSSKVTVISSAPSITWLFVMINPALASIMTPEPSPARGARLLGIRPPKKRSKSSSSLDLFSSSSSSTSSSVLIETTAGVTRSNSGAMVKTPRCGSIVIASERELNCALAEV